MFEKMGPIKDSFTTSSHYYWSQINVVEAVVLALVSEDLTLGTTARRWLDEDDWPIPRAKAVNWYLRAGGSLSMEAGPDGEAYDTFVFDPRDPCPTRGGLPVAP